MVMCKICRGLNNATRNMRWGSSVLAMMGCKSMLACLRIIIHRGTGEMGGLYTQVQLIRGHTRRIIKAAVTANCQYIFAELSREC